MPKLVFVSWELASTGGTSQQRAMAECRWRPEKRLQWRHQKSYVRQRWFESIGKGMCLAIPGKILDCQHVNGMRLGRVQFGGVVRSVSLDFVPEAVMGDYVMVHVGFAISRIAREEADRTYTLLAEMGALEEELAVENAPDGNRDTN
jgi:hydrogenase expression/formation protein HypC